MTSKDIEDVKHDVYERIDGSEYKAISCVTFKTEDVIVTIEDFDSDDVRAIIQYGVKLKGRGSFKKIHYHFRLRRFRSRHHERFHV